MKCEKCHPDIAKMFSDLLFFQFVT
jgi:hypothetical protein